MSPPAQSEEETGTEVSESELSAFESFSDEALVHAGTSPLHLIALHRRYTRLVDTLTAQRALSQQVWLRAFEVLERDPHALLPVADRLTQVAQKVLAEASVPGKGTFLPDPLAWYLRSVLENLPQPLRVVLILVEVERRSPEEIAGFFAIHQIQITASEALEHYVRAQEQLVEGLPPEVRRFYFDGVLDCLSLTPWLHLEITDEVRRFEVWRQAQTGATSPTQPQPALARRPWWVPAVVLGLLVVGGGLIWQSRQNMPTSSRPEVPILPKPPATSPQLKPAPSRSPEVPVLPQPPATSAPPEAPVLPQPPATPTAQKVSATPAPLWSGRTYLLVAAPELEGFARLRTIDRNIYYRQYQGRPHVQIGVYATRSSAEAAGVQVSRLGFEPIYAPAITP